LVRQARLLEPRAQMSKSMGKEAMREGEKLVLSALHIRLLM
jgi:hypothetical protein